MWLSAIIEVLLLSEFGHLDYLLYPFISLCLYSAILVFSSCCPLWEVLQVKVSKQVFGVLSIADPGRKQNSMGERDNRSGCGTSWISKSNRS